MNEMIRICDVEKYYGNGSNVVKAVDRVSFQVEEGEFVGIMGASGSGKSTLLHLMAAIDHVTSGHIYFGELDITQLSEEALADFRKESLGFVFQNYNLLDTLTIEENIQLAQTLQNKKRVKFSRRPQRSWNVSKLQTSAANFLIRFLAVRNSAVLVREPWSMIPN